MTDFKTYEPFQITYDKKDLKHLTGDIISNNKFYKLWMDYLPKVHKIEKLRALQLLKLSIKNKRFDKDCSKLSKQIKAKYFPEKKEKKEKLSSFKIIKQRTLSLIEASKNKDSIQKVTSNTEEIDNISEKDFDDLLIEDEPTKIKKSTKHLGIENIHEELLNSPQKNQILMNTTTNEIDIEKLHNELVDSTPQENYILMDGPLNPPSQIPKTISYNRGQLPPRSAKEPVNEYLTRDYNFGRSTRSSKIGKRPPVDGFTQFEKLELGLYPQQLWPDIIATWKNMVIQKFYKDLSTKNITLEDMYKYLETTLGNTAFNLWQNYKKQYPSEYDTLVSKGLTPYNFVNEVSQLITGSDPNMGGMAIQSQAYRDLEQIQLNSLDKLPIFLTDYISLAGKAQLLYNEDIMKKLLNKIPDPLGMDLQKQYEPDYLAHHDTKLRNVISLAHWIARRVQIKCQEIKIAKEIKNSTSFCKNVYLPQSYGNSCDTCQGPCHCRKKKKYKDDKYHPKHRKYRRYKKHYSIRKTNARPPYLRRDKHVRQFKKNRRYTKPVICYICNEPGHTSNICPQKGIKTARTALVHSTNMDLIEIDGPDLSETESIYSVYSIIGEADSASDSTDSSDDEDPNSLIARLESFNLL